MVEPVALAKSGNIMLTGMAVVPLLVIFNDIPEYATSVVGSDALIPPLAQFAGLVKGVPWKTKAEAAVATLPVSERPALLP